MVEGLTRYLRDGMLVLCDRNFFSYRFWSRLRQKNVAALFRLKTNLILHPDKELSDGSFLSKVYPSPYDREQDRGGIVVRVIRYTLDDPNRVGYGETHILLTTLLDPIQNPATELIVLYHERWEQEVNHPDYPSSDNRGWSHGTACPERYRSATTRAVA